jgi:hypothetical protein
MELSICWTWLHFVQSRLTNSNIDTIMVPEAKEPGTTEHDIYETNSVI